MSVAVREHGKGEFYSNNMGRAAFISALFHIIVFILATVGLPYFATKPEPVEMAIAVDFVDIDDISQTNNEEPPPPPKPIYNNTDSMPDLLSPKEPELAPEIEGDVPPPPPKELDKPEEKPDISKLEKPPKPKNKPRRPEPPVKKAPKKEEKPAQNDFNSILKSLTPDEPEEKPRPSKDASQEINPSQVADFSKSLTRSEKDNLNRGVQPCWNVNAGGRDAENLIVALRVFVNPDMRVREVQILDKLRYNTDTHFRASAEAARRALLNPRCSSLNLPMEKYEQWKVFKYNFDPSNML